MKTLNEVITIIEKFWVCPSSDEADEYCELLSIKDDVLQYLKAYKDDKDDLTALRAYWAEQQGNPPLIWEEIKMMVGKPLWIEGGWQVIDCCSDDCFSTDCGAVFYRKNDECYGDYGKDWYAYRKGQE